MSERVLNTALVATVLLLLTFASAPLVIADEPWVTSITVEPSSTDLEVGESEDFYAIATYSDGENEIVTFDANWTVNPPNGGSFIFKVILGYPYKIACFTLENRENNVTVTASYMGYSDNAPVFPWRFWATSFRLENLYAVHLERTLDLNQGSKLVVKFYTYDDGYENEKVIETFTPPCRVEENEIVQHPEGISVKKVRLDLTTDNTENVISTIASFTVTKDVLYGRIMAIKGLWPFASPDEQDALFAELMDIYAQWPFAPD